MDVRFEAPFVEPEAACGISVGFGQVSGQILDNQRPQETLEFLKWTQAGKVTHKRPSAIKQGSC
jgi:hypothetical protein